jgi:thioredoxin 2
MSSPAAHVVQCPACGAKNKIPAEKAGQAARCGRCKASLAAAGTETGGVVIRCSHCRTKNRLPPRASGGGRCGKCGTALATSGVFDGRPLEVSDGDFDAQVMHSPLPVLVEVYAPWCGPCQMVAPVMDELAAGWRGRGRVCKLNMDANPATAARFQVHSVPSFLIFDNGQLKENLVGALPKQHLIQKMTPYFY